MATEQNGSFMKIQMSCIYQFTVMMMGHFVNPPEIKLIQIHLQARRIMLALEQV